MHQGADVATAKAGYSGLQKTLHWVIALAVVGMIPVGATMADRAAANIFDDLTNTLYSWHKLVGFTVLWLAVLRLAVRAGRGAPPLPDSVSGPQAVAANVVHFALYALLIIVPMTGWAGVTAFPALITVGGYHLPALPFVPVDQDLAKQIFAVHGTLAVTLAALALAHLAAALFHLVVKRDGVFQRMWFGRG